MIKDKVVVITGGAGLLGREFVKTVVENDAIAIVADIEYEKAKTVESNIKEELHKDNIDSVQLDITSKSSIQNCIEEVSKKYSKIDAVVNNAYPKNKNYGRHFFDVEYEDFCENVNMHLGGYFLVAQQFAEYFVKQGFGNIINIASVYGVIAPKFEIYEDTDMTTPIEYAAIKSSIIHLTKYIAKYLKGNNIRVNSISPGGILDNQNTTFIKAYKDDCLDKGMLNPSDISSVLLFLLSDFSQSINGQNIVVDDGYIL